MEQRIEINRTEDKNVDMSAVWILIDNFFNNEVQKEFTIQKTTRGKNENRGDRRK